MRIYLTGFMASGKTTVGQRLAAALGYAFVDLDEAVAAQAGKSVPQLFADEGEAAFRALEAAALRATVWRDQLVVATGGGALASEANIAWALQAGVVVYLHVPVAELRYRLFGLHDRPLLWDTAGRLLSEAALEEKIATLLTQREPFYRQAHLLIEATGEVDAVVLAVVEGLAGRETE